MCSLRSILIAIVGLLVSATWLAMLTWPCQAPGQTAASPSPSKPLPKQSVDAAQLERLIRQLGSESFEEREAASKELDAIGQPAMPALRKARESADLEVRRRVAALLKSIEQKRLRMRAKALDAIRRVGGEMTTEDGTPNGSTLRVDLEDHGGAIRPSNAEAVWLPYFDDAQYVSIRFGQIGDDGLAYLETFYRVRGLSLEASKRITDAGLKHIGKLVTLRDLSLSDTLVTDAGLPHLKNLRKLRFLDLSGTRITDAGLQHFKNFKELTGLNLGRTQVTDEGMEHVKEIKMLTWLKLDRTHITDAGLAKLKSLKRLEFLSLSETQVTDAGLAHLRDIQTLYILHANGTKVTKQGKAEWIKRAEKRFKEIEESNKAAEAKLNHGKK
ncbi:MAG TPA: hypothetical protein VH575_26220 [Gemmataceae bacterium]|jgi:hypothetical protein